MMNTASVSSDQPIEQNNQSKEAVQVSSESEDEIVEETDPDKTVLLKVRFAFEYEEGELKIELPEYTA
jgi:hypothetical protein